MNIAYILNSTIPNGGATKAFMNLLDGLQPKGIKPFVAVPDRDGVYKELQRRRIDTFVATYRAAAYPPLHTPKQLLMFVPKLAARLLANRRATNTLTDWLRQNHIDIVHSNTSVVRIGFDAAQRVGIPHIYHIREYGDLDFGIHYFPCRHAFHKQLEQTDSYSICITKDILHYNKQGSKTSRVIYDGVFGKLTTMPKHSGDDYFLFMGRVEYAKGLDLLLEAYSKYAETESQPLPLKVAGSTNNTMYFKKLCQFVDEHRLSDEVQFLGNCDDVASLLQSARALIIPSRKEGFGFCMPEAMQQGCLCIAFDAGGTKEQLDNALELTGKEIALRYNTTPELTELLTEVGRHSSDYYMSYKELAFNVVNKLYTKENNSKQIYEFYKEILNK